MPSRKAEKTAHKVKMVFQFPELTDVQVNYTRRIILFPCTTNSSNPLLCFPIKKRLLKELLLLKSWHFANLHSLLQRPSRWKPNNFKQNCLFFIHWRIENSFAFTKEDDEPIRTKSLLLQKDCKEKHCQIKMICKCFGGMLFNASLTVTSL